MSNNDVGLDEFFSRGGAKRATPARDPAPRLDKPSAVAELRTSLEERPTTVDAPDKVRNRSTEGPVDRAPHRRVPVGRPPAPVGERFVDRVKQAAFYMDIDGLERLDRYAAAAGRTKSDVMRTALSKYLDEHHF